MITTGVIEAGSRDPCVHRVFDRSDKLSSTGPGAMGRFKRYDHIKTFKNQTAANSTRLPFLLAYCLSLLFRTGRARGVGGSLKRKTLWLSEVNI